MVEKIIVEKRFFLPLVDYLDWIGSVKTKEQAEEPYFQTTFLESGSQTSSKSNSIKNTLYLVYTIFLSSALHRPNRACEVHAHRSYLTLPIKRIPLDFLLLS